MTEDDYLEQLHSLWPASSSPSPLTMADLPRLQPQVKAALALAETALRALPTSATLWCRQGELLLLSQDHDVKDARECFERAIQLNPRDPQPHQLLGDYHDNILDDPRAAEPWYQKSIELGGGPSAYLGLAQCLAEQNKINQALTLLTPPQFPYAVISEVTTLKKEIREGLWTPSPDI